MGRRTSWRSRSTAAPTPRPRWTSPRASSRRRSPWTPSSPRTSWWTSSASPRAAATRASPPAGVSPASPARRTAACARWPASAPRPPPPPPPPRLPHGPPRRPERLLPPHGDEQEDLPHREEGRRRQLPDGGRPHREERHPHGRLRPLRRRPRGLAHAQGRRGGREEAAPHRPEGPHEALLQEAPGEDRPALHRHQLQARARALPDRRGEGQVPRTPGVEAEVRVSSPWHGANLGVVRHFCGELYCRCVFLVKALL